LRISPYSASFSSSPAQRQVESKVPPMLKPAILRTWVRRSVNLRAAAGHHHLALGVVALNASSGRPWISPPETRGRDRSLLVGHRAHVHVALVHLLQLPPADAIVSATPFVSRASRQRLHGLVHRGQLIFGAGRH
jgi:hypothetical protein